MLHFKNILTFYLELTLKINCCGTFRVLKIVLCANEYTSIEYQLNKLVCNFRLFFYLRNEQISQRDCMMNSSSANFECIANFLHIVNIWLSLGRIFRMKLQILYFSHFVKIWCNFMHRNLAVKATVNVSESKNSFSLLIKGSNYLKWLKKPAIFAVKMVIHADQLSMDAASVHQVWFDLDPVKRCVMISAGFDFILWN